MRLIIGNGPHSYDFSEHDIIDLDFTQVYASNHAFTRYGNCITYLNGGTSHLIEARAYRTRHNLHFELVAMSPRYKHLCDSTAYCPTQFFASAGMSWLAWLLECGYRDIALIGFDSIDGCDIDVYNSTHTARPWWRSTYRDICDHYNYTPVVLCRNTAPLQTPYPGDTFDWASFNNNLRSQV